MTVDTLLIQVRNTIGDQKKTKYTDDRLLELVNEGMTDIVKETHIFRKTTDILVENGITEYILPDDVYFLTRVTQNTNVIPFYSFHEMDEKFGSWWEDVEIDCISAIVYDQQDMSNITIYPELNGIGGTYFKLPDGTSVEMESGDSGPITYINASSNTHTVAVERDDDNYGALVSIEYDWFPVTINYVKKPKEFLIADIATDSLELDNLHIPAIKYYVAGTVLFDDSKIENTQKGTVLLGKYKDLIKDMRSKSMRNFHRVNRNVQYRTPFN